MRTIVKAHNENLEQWHELILANAYHGARLGLTDPKHFPETFHEWIGKDAESNTAGKYADMSDAQMWANLNFWIQSNKARPN